MLFEQAQALPPGARAAFLDEACGTDTDLRQQLDSLLGADEEAKAYFSSLAEDIFADMPTQAEVAPSSVRPPPQVSHYKILEKLGGGGMGVVYKALDARLDRHVALKFLPPLLSANELAKQRFVAEAKAASALDHSNICTIHEIGETDDGQLFIAMACYQGETLKKKIQRGPLPLEDALDYAVQTAQGLMKAHLQGIVHRDIKPANIMVTDDGVVKILDFGLAKMADLQLTQTGTTMGTTAYMSPEQARGNKVDHRTDLWSLGVVFYEMLTGQRPFRGDYDQAIIYSLLNDEPPSILKINPAVPEALEHVVAMCLEKERDLRYPTMADLLADLSTFTEGSGSDLSAPILAARRRASRRRRRVFVGAAGGLVLLAVLALLIPASRQTLLAMMGVSPAPTYVAVIPFTSANAEDQARADGLVQAVTSMVARLETAKDSLWVIPASEIVSRDIKSAVEARKMLGATTVVQIEVQHLGAETRINLNLVDPRGEVARALDSATLPGPLDPAFQDEALTALAGLLSTGVDAQARQAVTLDRPTTPDAYAFYLQGTGYLQRYDQAGNIENAITLFAQAVEEDSLYALAHAGLCEATWENYRRTNNTALADKAIASCDDAARLADDQAAVLIPLGSVYLRTGEDEKAETTLQRALELEPDNADAYRWLGRVYENQLQIDKAEQAYLKAIALKPNIWIYYNELGAMYFNQGRYEEAAPQFQQVSRLTPDNHLAYNHLAFAQLNLNKVEEAKRLYQRSIDLQPSALAFRNYGRLYFREQQYDEAVRLLEKARDMHEAAPSAFNDWVIWSHLGHAYYWNGDHAKAREAWKRLIEITTSRLQVNPSDDLALRLLADAHIALGNREQGLSYLNRLFTVPHRHIRVKYYIGRTYEMLGDRDLALIWIEQALENRFDPVIPDRDPWLEDLRKDARYQDLQKRFLGTIDRSAS